jgi:hypothetical protein
MKFLPAGTLFLDRNRDDKVFQLDHRFLTGMAAKRFFQLERPFLTGIATKGFPAGIFLNMFYFHSFIVN